MLKKVFKYTDYNGTERTEEHYFDISKSEFTKMELSTPAGMTAMLEEISLNRDGKKMCETIDTFISISYGVKSADGRRFEKRPEALQEFKYSRAYDELFMECATDHDKLVEFIKGIMPFSSEDAIDAE